MLIVSCKSPSAKIICLECREEWSTHWLLFVLLQSHWSSPTWRLDWRHTGANILIYCNHHPLADHCYQCPSCTVQWDSNQYCTEQPKRRAFSEYSSGTWNEKSTRHNQEVLPVHFRGGFNNSTFSWHYSYSTKCMVNEELRSHMVHSMHWCCVHTVLHFWSGWDFSFGMA